MYFRGSQSGQLMLCFLSSPLDFIVKSLLLKQANEGFSLNSIDAKYSAAFAMCVSFPMCVYGRMCNVGVTFPYMFYFMYILFKRIFMYLDFRYGKFYVSKRKKHTICHSICWEFILQTYFETLIKSFSLS